MHSFYAMCLWWLILGVCKESFAFHNSFRLPIASSYVQYSNMFTSRWPSVRMDGQLQLSQTEAVLVNQMNTTQADVGNVDGSELDLDEAQILLACRAYLSRRNKLQWRGKKVRREQAALLNEGYFWSDPKELLYLRDNPDPFDLLDNETVPYDDEVFNSADNVDALPAEEMRVEYSNNPFSIHQLYPSEEHVRRSQSRAHLWSNETWKEEWYSKRWKGRKVTADARKRKKTKKRIDNLPSSIMGAPELESLSEEEVVTATLSYIRLRENMSEAKKNNQRKKIAQREEWRQRRRALREEAEGMALLMKSTNSTRSDIHIIQKSIPLTFEPSSDVMTVLKTQRSLKAKLAYLKRETRKWRSTKDAVKQASVSMNETTKLRNYTRVEMDSDTAIQAILRINDALDGGNFPSVVDVETILRPGRMGRRKNILLRILKECFGMQGKCVPKKKNGNVELHFATVCSIQDLGDLVLSMLKNQ